MLDSRIYTFLELCKLMNYRKTAEALCMTQPAVTQHIQHLERQYQCKLFSYDGRVLKQTEHGAILEHLARTMVYTDKKVAEQIAQPTRRNLAIGATKTIGEYMIEDMVMRLLRNEEIEVTVIVENTQKLLQGLNHFALDLLLLEGHFDKNVYGYRHIKTEPIVGICAIGHPFAGKTVSLQDIFTQHILLREKGSGTRAVFDDFLRQQSHSADSFVRKSVLSNYTLLRAAVAQGVGISFVYQAMAQQSENLASFTLEGYTIAHEFNYVFLQGAPMEDVFELLEKQ